MIQWTIEIAVYTILYLPLRTAVDTSPEEVAAVVEADVGVHQSQEEVTEVHTRTYKYTKDILYDKEEKYHGQDGIKVQRLH